MRGGRQRREGGKREGNREKSAHIYTILYIPVARTVSTLSVHSGSLRFSDFPPSLSYRRARPFFFFRILCPLTSLLVQSHTIQSDEASNVATINCDHRSETIEVSHGNENGFFFSDGVKSALLVDPMRARISSVEGAPARE